ncbi:DUF4962 domain-containing protein [Pseudoduganella flava]|nr:DUF4962 domain-containing protein [Pseudoduganella flava]
MALALALTFGQAHGADWAKSTDPLVVVATPSDLRVQVQNPPTFAWPRHSTNPAAYVLEIRSGTTVVRTYTANRNWYLPSVALPNGTYTWRVRPSTTTEWSADRSFVVTDASTKFEVPEDSTLISRVTSKARPRGLQSGLPLYVNWPTAMQQERGQYVTWLSNEVKRQITGLGTVKDSDWPLQTSGVASAEVAAQTSAIRSAINKLTRQLEGSVILYRLTGDPIYLNEARRRGDEMVALDPNGPTSYANQDQATRAIIMSLMKGIDYLAADLDATRRANWLRIVTVRGEAMYNALAQAKGDMDQFPLDSHGGTAIGFLALASTLALGDIPEADKWFRFAFRFYVSSMNPWSGPEGGYGNGTAYGEYTIDYYLQTWQALGQATGVNLFDKPWSQGFLKFFMEMMPPGTRTHMFGDGHETAPEMKFMKALALRYKTPQAAWYARNLVGTEDPLTYLQGPYPMPALTVATPAPPPNAALFQSIGWAAFHSDLRDMTNRTSVFFKSSPYGSFNHSHGDQNSFVLKKGGVGLLTEAGWYDWYNSPNWSGWYRQTKAHNAITYDGGIGQVIDGWREPKAFNGQIIAYGEYGNTYYVAGSAATAFPTGAMTQNIRRLWYLRTSDAVVIHDQLASPIARTFEWNFHALAPINVDAAGLVSVTNAGRTVCLRPVSDGLRFERRTGGASLAGTTEYHGAFVGTSKVTSKEMLIVLDVGCKNPAIRYDSTSTNRTLTVGTDTLNIPR